MSVHSFISSNITGIGDLIAILNELGIEWREGTGIYMKATGRPPAHAIEAVIGNEAVLIFQVEEGSSFVFQSKGWRFRNSGNIQALAAVQSAEQLQAQNQLNEQKRLEEERRRREERERRQREEAERNRIAQEQRKIVEKQQRIEEQKRQARLADEVKHLLAQLDARQSQLAQPESDKPAAQSPAAPPASPAAVQEMDRLIGKLHQADALRKIRGHLPELKEKFDATLEREETLDDETVELRLTIF